jgi:hypothetical protein
VAGACARLAALRSGSDNEPQRAVGAAPRQLRRQLPVEAGAGPRQSRGQAGHRISSNTNKHPDAELGSEDNTCVCVCDLGLNAEGWFFIAQARVCLALLPTQPSLW